MTDKTYDIAKIEELDGTFLISVVLYSKEVCDYDEDYHAALHENRIRHNHQSSKTSTMMQFDHSPSEEDILAKAEEYGHKFVIEPNPRVENFAFETIYNLKPILAITETDEEHVHWSATLHRVDFLALLSQIPIQPELEPSIVCKKGEWFYMYWTKAVRPTEFFEDDYFLYSVRVHETTKEIKRKGYYSGNPLNLPEFEEVLGDLPTIATGVYLDEDDMITIYYPKSLSGEDHVDNVFVVDTPYLGSTFHHGELIKTTEYRH
jgi:hypothetical protein